MTKRKTDKLGNIFFVEYPKTMSLNKQKRDEQGVNFVSTTGSNNGVTAKIVATNAHKRYKAGAITVALKGSVLSAFLQPVDFYIAHQTAVLYPKKEMTVREKLFYCLCISENRFRYSFGRQADKTLRELLLPKRECIPEWVDSAVKSMLGRLIEQLDRMDF